MIFLRLFVTINNLQTNQMWCPMAINQIDKELNDRLMSYANTLARGDRALEQTLKQQAKSLGAVQQDVVAEYEEYLSKSRTWHGKEAEEAKARLIRMRKLERDAQAAQQEGIEAKIKHNKILKQIDDEQANLAAGATNLSKAEVARRRAALAQQRTAAIQSFKEDTTARTSRYQLGMRAAAERRAFENKELGASAKWGNAFRSSLSVAGQTALTKAFGSLSIAAGIEKIASSIFTAVNEGTKHGTGLSYNPFDDSAIGVFGAAKHGYNTDEWMKMLNSPETQQAIRSSQKGMYDFAAGLELVDKDVRLYGIKAQERSEIARKNMELMSSSGIRMQAADATAFHDSMVDAKNAAGMAPEEFQNAMSEILQSEEVRTQLKMATSELERRTIVDGIAAQLAQNKAMGMTTTEATAAAKALGKLAGEKPLDRLKKAAKLRAYGAAMGMGAEGNRLADLTMKKKRTPAEEAEYKRIGSQLSEQYTQAGADGNLGAEIFATQLADKLGLEQMLGPNSPFNTTLAAAAAPLQSAADSFSKTPDALSKVFAEAEQAFSSLAKNDIISGLGRIGGALVGGKGLSVAKGLFTASRAAPALVGAGATAAEAGGIGTAAATGAAGIGAGAIASIVAAVAASGTDLYSGYKFAKGEDASNWISDGFDKLTDGWNMFEALDKAVGGPLAQNEAKIDQMNRTVEGKITPVQQPTAEIKKKESTTPVPPTVEQSKAAEKEKAEATKQDAATVTAENSKEQVKKLVTGNDLLQQIAETTQRQVELSEKQLIALTLTEREKSDSQNRTNLRKDNRFGSQYGYA